MDKESAIQSIIGIGQSIPRQFRETAFHILNQHLTNDAVYLLEADHEFLNRPDIIKAIDLIKRATNDIDPLLAHNLLNIAAAMTNIMEDQLLEQMKHQNTIEYVVTHPAYLSEKEHAALKSSLWTGSLLDALNNMITQAAFKVDIINPYWSPKTVDDIFRGITTSTCTFRILTLITEKTSGQNNTAIRMIRDIITGIGAKVTFYSPTSEQVLNTDAIAPIHAKCILCDEQIAYVGSANLSKGGLQNGLEIGAIHQGPALKPLVNYINWLFSESTVYLENA